MRIELTAHAWEAWVLPLYDARRAIIVTGFQRTSPTMPQQVMAHSA